MENRFKNKLEHLTTQTRAYEEFRFVLKCHLEIRWINQTVKFDQRFSLAHLYNSASSYETHPHTANFDHPLKIKVYALEYPKLLLLLY